MRIMAQGIRFRPTLPPNSTITTLRGLRYLGSQYNMSYNSQGSTLCVTRLSSTHLLQVISMGGTKVHKLDKAGACASSLKDEFVLRGAFRGPWSRGADDVKH